MYGHSERRLLALVLGTIAAAAAAACTRSTAAQAPPPEVAVVEVAARDVAVTGEWSARLDAYVTAQIRPQVTGHLLDQRYREGAVVRKGEVLFDIDPRPFEAALANARSQLLEAQTQLEQTQMDVRRHTPLASQGAIPQSQVDADVRAFLAARAAVETAKAAVDAAVLNLGFTRVTSPVSGVAAIATIETGALVTPATLLTSVSQVDPIKAYFPIKEQEYLGLARRLAIVAGGPALGLAVPLRLVLADGLSYPYSGSFLASDRQVDETTGTIRVAAVFANPGNVLRPGQHGTVQATTRTIPGAITVPHRAVAGFNGAYQVKVVGPDSRLRVQAVKLGVRVGSAWVIEDGLRPGERVLVDPEPSLSEGALVRPAVIAIADGPH